MAFLPSLYPLQGKVLDYGWGGYSFIAHLLGSRPTGAPQAEYWLGSHPAQPSEILFEGKRVSLHEFLEEHDEKVLGRRVALKFSGLPYLLKVLDVRQMLSIQVHPDKISAAIAFQEENKKGISLDAPHRNYKDQNHKPELMVALTDFWLLHGFKPAHRLQDMLAAEPDLHFLLNSFENGGYENLYKTVMDLPQADVNRVLQPMINRIVPLYRNGELQKGEEDFWAARAAETFCKNGQADRGIFSIYLFNLLHLKKGEGIYQPARLPHAYLEGQNVEIMATSDNVLRAGLTDKHIDVPELMKHVRFEATDPMIIKKSPGAHSVYKCPAEEFELSSYEGAAGARFSWITTGPEILLVLEGSVTLSAGEDRQQFNKGAAAFIIAGTPVEVAMDAGSLLYRAAVPE